MPKAGNSVESCIIVEWKKQVGDVVAVDDVLCEVETDKATMDVPAPAAGSLLAIFFKAGDDVPVMTNIAAVGQPGEEVSSLAPAGATQGAAAAPPAPQAVPVVAVPVPDPVAAPASAALPTGSSPVSPRARTLAERKGVDATTLAGTGPSGRVIERDVQAAAAGQPKLTPVAKAMVAEGGFALPPQGSGPGGRIMSKDLVKEAAAALPSTPSTPAPIAAAADEVEIIPLKGIRKVIAERMLNSLQTTAQLTLNASADARGLQALRKRLKESPEALGLRGITITDLVLLAAARTLPSFPSINALFTGDAIQQHKRVHMGIAVDTPRGLMVPVVRGADGLTLRQLSAEAKRLATACIEGKVLPDELNGGTFTVTNLGHLGIESFTPVLNPPQVAILGVCNIQPKPIEQDGQVIFAPHIGLSLTINHQVVDGAPAARFVQALCQAIAQIDLLLAG